MTFCLLNVNNDQANIGRTHILSMPNATKIMVRPAMYPVPTVTSNLPFTQRQVREMNCGSFCAPIQIRFVFILSLTLSSSDVRYLWVANPML